MQFRRKRLQRKRFHHRYVFSFSLMNSLLERIIGISHYPQSTRLSSRGSHTRDEEDCGTGESRAETAARMGDAEKR